MSNPLMDQIRVAVRRVYPNPTMTWQYNPLAGTTSLKLSPAAVK
jgi:hypothetical protein